ncbi:MAG: TM1802 family CRISPR-associated protein [bacterium]
MGLLPAVQDKLEQYDSFDKWRRLAQESSKYLLVNTGDGWRLSINEINFYFACGMNLMEQVTNIIDSENKEEE